MESWQNAAIIIGVFSGVGGVIAIFVKVGNALRARAKWEQQLMSDVSELKDGQAEGRENERKILDALNRHVSDSGIHINPLLEQREYDAAREFRQRVEAKLDTLAGEIRSKNVAG